MEYEMVHAKGVNTAALAQFLHKADNAGVIIPFIVLFAIGAVLGVILLGIASWRTRVVPIWAAVVIIIAGPVNFIGQSHVANIISNVVLLVALGSLGVAALRMSDEEWESPREPAAVPAGQVQAATA
jgi:glucan phosphoethanolaminetransferase (alkaline phosphatase superfamily)